MSVPPVSEGETDAIAYRAQTAMVRKEKRKQCVCVCLSRDLLCNLAQVQIELCDEKSTGALQLSQTMEKKKGKEKKEERTKR